MADPLSAAGLALAVFTAFKDVYQTVKFIKAKIHSLRHFQAERSDLITDFEIQIARLENNSRILSRGKDKGPDVNYLQTVPKKYLQLVRKVFAELQRILAEYIRYAALGDSQQGAGTTSSSEDEKKKWFNFGPIWPQRAIKDLVTLEDLPGGLQWLFTKDKMAKLLKRFMKWNKDLEYLIPVLLEGFSVDKDTKAQTRLKAFGGPVGGHLSLIGLSQAAEKGTQVPEALNVEPIPWSQAQEKLKLPRVLIEEKISGVGQSQTTPEMAAKAILAQKEVYTPQLARLLRKAGEQDLRTLALNAYAWDPSEERCLFFFDYPDFAADSKPLSLYDLLSAGDPNLQLDLAQRFYVASAITRSIGAFHCDGWVHKGVRANAIKFFYDIKTNKCAFTHPYLTEFEYSRPDSGLTALEVTPFEIDHDVYRHPLRHGLPTPERFTRIFDIYSLGVVLLEIGLWKTAKEMYGELRDKKSGETTTPPIITGNDIKEYFELKAREGLKHRMGPAYQEAVLTCLGCDLEDFLYTTDFASEFQRQVVEKVDMRALLAVSMRQGDEGDNDLLD